MLSEVVEQKRFELATGDGTELVFHAKTSTKVRANRSVMRRVISNVLNNAVEAVESSGGSVEVNSQIVNGKVEIRVNDSGVRMSDQTFPRLEHESFTTKAELEAVSALLTLKVLWNLLADRLDLSRGPGRVRKSRSRC